MLVSLECLNDPRYSFEALTDSEGKITTWFAAREDWIPNGSAYSVHGDDFDWKLCFEIYRFAPAGSAILSIPVTFRMNRQFQRDIQLILDASQPQSYYVSIEDSPLQTRVATAKPLCDPTTSSATHARPTQADDDMWPLDISSDTSSADPGNKASSSRTSESAARSTWVDVNPSAIKAEQEESQEEYFRRLLSWSPLIPSPQIDVAASERDLECQAVDTAPSADDAQTPPQRPAKRPRTNGTPPRRSQRLVLRRMERAGEYVPLE